MSCLQYCEVWITGNKWVYDRSTREIHFKPHSIDTHTIYYMGIVSLTDSETLEEPDDLIKYINTNFLQGKTTILDETESQAAEIVEEQVVKDIVSGQAGGAIRIDNDSNSENDGL